MIKTSELYFWYNQETNIFRDFNFEITDSKFFGLIGVNGAGKSTFMKLCLGLLRPDRGTIEINGFDIQKKPMEVLKQVGVLQENPKFPSWIVVQEYLIWLGQLRGFTKEEAVGQANYLIDKLHLTSSKKKQVSELSAGLTQRFGLAQALIGVPRLIFLDEPTANLDVQSRYSVLEFLSQIVNEYDTQIVIMSHILSDLERYCDSFAILHEGSIVYRDTVAHALDTHSPKYYGIRIPPGADRDEIEEEIISLNLEIVNRKAGYIIVRLSDDQPVEKLNDRLSDGLKLKAYLSIMEQIFVDYTSNEEIFEYQVMGL